MTQNEPWQLDSATVNSMAQTIMQAILDAESDVAGPEEGEVRRALVGQGNRAMTSPLIIAAVAALPLCPQYIASITTTCIAPSWKLVTICERKAGVAAALGTRAKAAPGDIVCVNIPYPPEAKP